MLCEQNMDQVKGEMDRIDKLVIRIVEPLDLLFCV